MAKVNKAFRPVAVTANDLRSGRVLYRTFEGGWAPDVARAEIARDPARADALLAAAKADHDRGVVVEPFAISVDPVTGMPVALREQIRATGPTVGIESEH